MIPTTISVLSCQINNNQNLNPNPNLFVLKTQKGEIIEIFDYRKVKEYYYDGWIEEDWNPGGVHLKIKFKDMNWKKYSLLGNPYWYFSYMLGLKLRPNQDNHKAREISNIVWRTALGPEWKEKLDKLPYNR